MLISSVILLYAPASQKHALNLCQTAPENPPPLQPQTSLLPLSWKSISLSKENSLKLFQNLSHSLLSLQPKRALSSPSPQKTLCQQARNSPPFLSNGLLPLSGSLPHTPLLSAFLSLLVALKNLLK